MERGSSVAHEQMREEPASIWGKRFPADETRAKAPRRRHGTREVVAGRSACFEGGGGRGQGSDCPSLKHGWNLSWCPSPELLMAWEPGTSSARQSRDHWGPQVQHTHQGCVAAGLASHPVTAGPLVAGVQQTISQLFAAGVSKDSDTQGGAPSAQRQQV